MSWGTKFVRRAGCIGLATAMVMSAGAASAKHGAAATGPSLGTLTATGTDATVSTVAYDATSSRYLVGSVRGVDHSGLGPQLTRVTAAGAKVDASPRTYNFWASNTAITAASVAGRFVTVFTTSNRDLVSGTMDPATGAVSGITGLQGGGAYWPAMASLTNASLVAWSAYGQQGSAVKIMRLDAGGKPIVPQTGAFNDVPDVVVSTTGTRPAVATNGQGYLVVWSDWRTGDADIVGTTVSADGVPTGPPLVIAGGPGNQVTPSVAWSGGQYVVAWSDGDVKAARVQTSPLAAAVPVTVAATAGAEIDPVIAFDGQKLLVAWVAGTTAFITRLSPPGDLVGPTLTVATSIRTGTWPEVRGVAIAPGPTGKALVSVVRTNGSHYRTFTEG